jgi:hypothetical protein
LLGNQFFKPVKFKKEKGQIDNTYALKTVLRHLLRHFGRWNMALLFFALAQAKGGSATLIADGPEPADWFRGNPFTPTDWMLTFDGETVSLWPSIGNWNFKCRSHYIIRRSRVFEAEPWENKEVEHGRQIDKDRKQKHFQKPNRPERSEESQPQAETGSLGLWRSTKNRD